LNKLCQFPESQGWDLKYRASRDGFSGKNFCAKCEGVWNTLTIIKTTNGNIFGAFAEQEWTHGTNVLDHKAFIISLINKENKPFKAMIAGLRGMRYAIYCETSNGPSFGSNRYKDHKCVEISIASNSNTNQWSSSDIGFTFRHQDYPEGSEKAKTILAGSHNF